MNLNLLPARTSRLFFFVLVGLFCLSLVYFISRGPLRAVSVHRCDFTVLYLGSSLWLKGLNPYNHDDINRLWLEIDERADADKITGTRPAVYPIPIFPILTPLTFLDLPVAQVVWTGINCLALMGAILALIFFSKFKIFEKEAFLICCLALSLNSIHFGIKEGNPGILAGSLMVMSLWAADRDQTVLGGILFALSLCLKVNITIIFVLYFILTKKYKLLLISFLSVTLISFIAIMPYNLNIEWLYSWRTNVHASFAGGINDPNLTAPYGYFNLDYTSIKIIKDMAIIKIIDLLMLVAFISILYKYYKDMKYNYQKLLLLSYIVMINLLIMPYQRNYNGIILILPIALVFVLRKGQFVYYGNIILLLLIPFLFPLSAIIDQYLKIINYNWLRNSVWFDMLILGHRTWLLLIISIIIMRVIYLDYQATIQNKV
jgi:Glycosyltransferase family 87